MRRRTQLLVLVSALVAFAACSSGSSSGRHRTSPTTTTTVAPGTTTTVAGSPTPEEAIASYVQGQGNQYAGDCASTDPATDVGKWCSLLQDNRSDTRVYGIGPVASEIVTVVTLRRDAGGRWRVAMADPAPAPE